MNEDKIKEILSGLFAQPCEPSTQRHLIFWYDEERAYEDVLSDLVPESVKVHILTDRNNFSTKKLLEYDDPASNFLIYSPAKKPDDRFNWFLDTILYSREFTPDQVLLTAIELGIKGDSMKHLIKEYQSFFNSKERFKKFKSIFTGNTEEAFEVSMLAVLSREKSTSIEDILRKLFAKGVGEDNELYEEIKRYSLEERFWHYVERHFGYASEHPTLAHLFSSLVLTSLADVLREDFPIKWKPYLCQKHGNCILFIDHWIKDISARDSYVTLSLKFESDFDIPSSVKDWHEKRISYYDCDILKIFDREVIKYIIEKLLSPSADFNNLKTLVESRKVTHWYKEYEHIYEAIDGAIDIISLVEKFEKEGIAHATSEVFIHAYAREYYKVDQAYRRFIYNYDRITQIELPCLLEKVENLYENSFVRNLSAAWSDGVLQELIPFWSIPGIPHQQNFYNDTIKPVIARDDRGKVYVIISDGLRYEAAEELTAQLKRDEKVKADIELSFMQGVVPSYTRYGMASLLPHKDISLSSEGTISIDSMGIESTEERDKVLKKALNESRAITYSQMMDMTHDELREALKPARIVYVYHNTIDATGDKEVTEKKVFDAVHESMREIRSCVTKLVNAVSATAIFITADHGFLYQRRALDESDKLIKGKFKTIEEKKRSIIVEGEGMELSKGVLALSMSYLLGKNSPLKVITPKGIHRFKTPGAGINYVHGGMSLQEIVIPLMRLKAHKVSKQKKVEVKITNTSRTITNNKFTLHFFQTEKISESTVPRILKVSLWDDGEKISDEKTVVADRESDNATEREFKVIITLKTVSYDKQKNYYLKLQDGDDTYDMIPFKINIAFVDEFGTW